MTIGGWLIMITSVSSVTLFFGWALYRVLFGDKGNNGNGDSEESETPPKH